MANGTLAASQIEMLSLSGTGIITITPPATNTNRAITLPDAAGAIVVSGTTPSLNGITFPATQVASADANTLDDYEEGTWTPSFTPVSGSATYTNQVGNYVKIGRQVTAVFYITVNVSSSLTTGVIAGLPFTGSNTNYAGSTFSVFSGIGGYCNLLGLTAAGTTIQIRATSSATSAPTVTTLSVSNGGDIAGTVTYFTS